MAFVIQDIRDDRYAVTARIPVFTPEFSRRFNSVKQEKADISSADPGRNSCKAAEKKHKDQLFRADEINILCRFAVSRMCIEENGVPL